MSEKFEAELLEKLDLLIKLNVHSNINPNASQTDSIIRLRKMGLKPKQIAEALDTTQNYVNAILSKTKGARKHG